MAKASRLGHVLKRLGQILWIVCIAAGVSSYIVAPQLFTAENIAAFLIRFHNLIWLIYIAFSILRGLTLLPSTPLVIAGTMLFTGQPFTVLAVSIIGILLSSSMIYFFSEHLGFNEFFEGHKSELTHRIKTKLEHPLGSVFVALWAFFPLVPTDLVCYVAGTTKMNYGKFIVAIFVGELVLCSFYIFFGGAVLDYVR
ncbi:MAG: VTT domain-containing protein [Acidobacteriota bacterium]